MSENDQAETSSSLLKLFRAFTEQREIDRKEETYGNPDIAKIQDSIFNWTVKDQKCMPPESQLPECIKKRIRWGNKMLAYEPTLVFTQVLNLVLLEPEKEKETYQEIHDKTHDAIVKWLPLDQDYKDYYQKYHAYFDRFLVKAVAIALIYGLNDDAERAKDEQSPLDVYRSDQAELKADKERKNHDQRK